MKPEKSKLFKKSPDILARRCLTEDQWIEIKRFSDSLNMAFFSTVGFDEDFDYWKNWLPFLKIASADVNHFPLLRRAARQGCV